MSESTSGSVTVPYRRDPVDPDAEVRYAHGPDSVRRPGVSPGAQESFEIGGGASYPGTSRTIRVHIPSAYTDRKPAAVMFFLDGSLYLDPEGDLRAGIVIDNLVHAGEMPVTIGVFVDPGTPANRNIEYDPADDRFASFVEAEVVPRLRSLVRLTDDPNGWGIGGGSSGGNGAFTAAWHRPDRFRRVLSLVGSFAQIPGGNPYPGLIRAEAPRPLRIFQQAAARDLNWDQPDANWLSENLLVAAALAERGYDHRLIVGLGGHSTNHGGVLLPDAMRWLWRP